MRRIYIKKDIYTDMSHDMLYTNVYIYKNNYDGRII